MTRDEFESKYSDAVSAVYCMEHNIRELKNTIVPTFKDETVKKMDILEYQILQNMRDTYGIYRILDIKLDKINTKLDKIIEEMNK